MMMCEYVRVCVCVYEYIPETVCFVEVQSKQGKILSCLKKNRMIERVVHVDHDILVQGKSDDAVEPVVSASANELWCVCVCMCVCMCMCVWSVCGLCVCASLCLCVCV